LLERPELNAFIRRLYT